MITTNSLLVDKLLKRKRFEKRAHKQVGTIDVQSSEIFSLLLLQPKILYVDLSDPNRNTIRT